MGQYGNQPDFGTIAGYAPIAGDSFTETGRQPFKPAALYIGTGGTLICSVVGGNPGADVKTIFKNIPSGTFFPVIVNAIWATDSDLPESTTCADIIALY